MRNVLSQKFRRRQVTERKETTIIKKSDSPSTGGESSSGAKEFSRHSSMRDEINEEQCYSSNSDNPPRILHGTQSLHDARTFPSTAISGRTEFSREYPPILREQNLTKEKKNYRHSIMVPIERTNKEISDKEQSENFLRRQQQKLYKLHGGSLRKFGQTITPQGLDEEQRRDRQHASLPPMDRSNPYLQQNILQQLPFELIIDRYPPQLVRSIDKTKQLDIWTVSDSGIYHKRHEFPQESSFGFSPFPVHGPFMAEELLFEQESQINKRQESKFSGSYDSTNQYYSVPPTGQIEGMTSSAVMSSSDELWHSAYEYFPQNKKSTTQPQIQQFKNPQIKHEQNHHDKQDKTKAMSILAEENDSECNIQKSFHLKNICLNNLNISGCFSEKVELFTKFPKIMASNIEPQIETSTLSEQQANEEVRLLMHKGTKPSTKFMSKSVESTGTLQGEETTKEFKDYPVRVEISGPVHFLHATNMNVLNSSDNPTDYYSIQTSMTSSGGIKEFRQGTFEMSFSKNRQKSPSPTKWTQTDDQPEININLIQERSKTTKTEIEDKRESQVISPPLERFIESVCDIQPILVEISETICHQGVFPYEKLQESYLIKESNKNFNRGPPPPVPPKKHSIKRQPKYLYKIEEENIKNGKEYFKEINYQNPYLIQSSSHCHLARVTEITQEWLFKFNKLKNNKNGNKIISNEEKEGKNSYVCNIIVKPSYGQEFDKAEFWTMAWKENWNIEKSEKLKKERIYDNKADDGIYWTDDGINKKEGKLNYFEDKFSTLQASNRRVKGRQTGFQEKIHKTRSFNNDELPRLIEQNQYEELRRALLEVQRDLDSAQEYKRRNNNAEVERIENVILSISERIQHPNEPVSKAQAEAKEELLRVRLARMILNLDPDFEPKQKNIKKDNNDLSNENVFADIALESYYVRALREPIGLLREKLALLEHRLLSEQQLEINDQLIRIGLTPPPLRNLEQKLRKESLSQRSDEISRMTPLIVMLRHKLNALDDLCHKEQIKADTTNISGRLTPYEERKIVFDLLVRINTEIDTIHKLCREENVKERIEIVLKVLKKVSSSIDKIMETLKNMSASTTIATSRQPSTSSLSETKRNISNVDRPIIYQKQIDNQSSKLEQAILNKQKQQKGNIIQNQTKQTFLQRMKEKQSEKAEINKNKQFFEFPENIYSKHSKFYKQDNISLKSFDEEHESQTSRKKTPPQVPPKRKSLTSSIEERIGPLYSIIEENPSTSKQTNISKQRVNAVELSAHLDRPYESTSRVNAFIPLLTTRTATRIESPPLSPASVAKQPSLEISKNLSSDLAHSSKGFKDKSPFRLGPCPTSYLTREQQCQQQRITIGQKPSRICSSIDDDDVEEVVSVSIASSALDNSSCLSVPILFRRNSAISSVASASTFQQETAIIVEEIEAEENCTETFFLRRRNKHSILNAVIYPEQHASVKATFCGNNFQVDVERMSECGRDSVVMVSEEFCEKKVLIRSGSPLLKSTIMEEIERENSDSPGYTDAHTRMAVSINAKSDYDSVHVFLEEIPWGQIGIEVKESPSPLNNKRNKITTNISSDNNRVGKSNGMSTSIDSSLSRESVLKQISVSESKGNNGDNNSGRLSLLSTSRRSSQKSLANSTGSGTTAILVGGQEDLDDIPAYVIKIGSTASITCELNSDCISNMSNIEWIRGQNEQIICSENGKFERHFHDFIDVLVIYNVSHEDGQLYSIKINGEIYPVAYLIIEDNEEESDEMNSHRQSRTSVIANEEILFLTSPQTQFVMQGETAIISVSMNKANLDVYWHKDGQILDKNKWNNNNILFESTTNGWYRIIIQNVQFSDQGFYFAQIGDKFTSVQLIVEDRIDEREVQVSSAETDDEDLGDYLVPIGSTATIACELENVSFGYRLHWQRNHKDLDSRIVSDEGKFEHVVNGTKHYLIIHCAQPFDSGVYSVRIGDSKFKVAQITISNEQKLSNGSSSGSRIKRISSHSLNSK